MSLLISFSGAQSSGKTTLLNLCKRESADIYSVFNRFAFIPEVTRLVRDKYNLPINEAGNNFTQLSILSQHLENFLVNANRNVIMDRCILDGLIYTEYLFDHQLIDREVVNYSRYLYELLVKEIDIIFYTDPSIPLIDDGVRSIDVDFRSDIIRRFDYYIPTLKDKVKILTGSVQDRLDQIKRAIILKQ